MFKYLFYILFGEGLKMIYFLIAYLFLISFFIFQHLKSKEKNRSRQMFFESITTISVFGMLLYALIGIVTGDPLLTEIVCKKLEICLAPTYEWILFIALGLWILWKFVLVPMKKEIESLKNNSDNTKTNIAKIETSLDDVKKNTDLIVKNLVCDGLKYNKQNKK